VAAGALQQALQHDALTAAYCGLYQRYSFIAGLNELSGNDGKLRGVQCCCPSAVCLLLLLLLLCCGWRPVQASAHPVLLSKYCVHVACCGCVPAFVAAAAATAAVLCAYHVESRYKHTWEALVPYHTHHLALLALVLTSHNLRMVRQGERQMQLTGKEEIGERQFTLVTES
jgi:hypothetical protein